MAFSTYIAQEMYKAGDIFEQEKAAKGVICQNS